MKDKNVIEEKHVINIYYLNSKINDYSFPESFQDFKENISSIFNLSQNEIEQLNYCYHNEKSKINTEEEYIIQISKIKSLNKDKDINIYIEFSDDNNNDTFEEHIKLLVENEIKNAADRIINRFKYQKKNEIYNSREKICDICKKEIIGDMFKKVNDVEEKFFCENCSLDIQEALFIIN